MGNRKTKPKKNTQKQVNLLEGSVTQLQTRSVDTKTKTKRKRGSKDKDKRLYNSLDNDRHMPKRWHR
jgi:hypothetical protein